MVFASALAVMGCRDERPSAPHSEDGTSETGGGTESSEGGSSDDGTVDEVPVVPPPGGMRRLLQHQYVASIDQILGPAAAAVATPPRDPSLATFDAQGTWLSVPSTADIEDYEATSFAVALAALAEPSVLAATVPCVVEDPGGVGCYEALARDLGRLMWRRPLTDAQVARLVAVGDDARESEGDAMAGLESMLALMLQAPRFLYVVEVGMPGAPGEPRELDGYELATRMTLLLTGQTPSAAVFDRVEAGELDTDEGVRALAWELLDSPRARGAMWRFFAELLTVRDLPTKSKDSALFSEFSPLLAGSMLEETLRLVDDVVFVREASVLELFDADYTFVDDRLAAHYGMPSPGPGQWARTSLPAEQGRAGVLTHASWLTMQSHTRVNSPTRRGLFVLEQLLCLDLPLPPPRANPEPIEPDDDETLRETLIRQTEDPACSSCHVVMDPVGFAFEHFDPVGARRELDNGQPIDASGQLAGVGGFDGAAELAELLARDPRLGRCLVDRALTGGLGVVPNEDVRAALDDVAEAFVAGDHDMKRLLVELSVSPVFRQVDEPL